jgi:hypothetical protein
MLVISALLTLAATAVVVYVGFRPTKGERFPDPWAGRRGVALTVRSRPYVDAYLRQGPVLRAVGVLIGSFLPMAVTAGTGIDLGVPGLVWIFAGYLTAGVLTEVALGRVPASPTRVASLAVRRRDRYVARWLTRAQVAVPAAVVAFAAIALRVDARPQLSSVASLTGAFGAEELRRDAVACAVAAVLALAVTLAAQQWIVRRPRPCAEPDLAAADEVLRTSTVHLLGVTQTATALVLAGGALGYVGAAVPWTLSGWVAVPVFASVLAAFLLWSVRLSAPDLPGGAVAPPPFDPEQAAAALLIPSSGDPAPARRMTVWTVGGATAAVLVVLAMAALHWVGPFNPAVQVSAAEWRIQPDGSGVARFDVFNASLVPVTLEAATLLVPPAGGATAVTGVSVWPATGGDPTTGDLPLLVPRRRGVIVEVRVAGPRPCAPTTPPASTGVAPAVGPVEVTWSTPVGLRRSAQAALGQGTFVDGGIAGPLGCTDDLPTGPPPADPVAAQADIEQAFATVYGGPPNPAVKSRRIDVFDGLDGVSAEAYRRGYGPQMEKNRATVERVSFDRPDHAWIAYRLGAGGTTVGNRRGEAVLVDGVWKITRATVCQDLSLTGARCP